MTYNVFDGYRETNNYNFEIYDEEEAVEKFRKLCEPNISFDIESTCWFYLVTYYLHKCGYEIKEFPRVLARPPLEPGEFTYGEIRDEIISQGGDENGTVRYDTRRGFVKKLTFEKKIKHITIDDEINQKFMEISNRHASFNTMSKDEKLAELANLIENMIKIDGSYHTLDYSSVCFDYITDHIVKSYRKKMHCFRHSTNDAIEERKSYTEEQKDFLVDYGVVIIKSIFH